jgi:hypothetical protein
MFRYRCPHCSAIHQAPDLRAGRKTVCSKCSQPLTIPADQSQWLDAKGEPLFHSPPLVQPGEPARTAIPELDHSEVIAPSPEPVPQSAPAPSFSRSLPEPEEEEGRVELYPPTPVVETPRPPRTPPPSAVPRRPVPAALQTPRPSVPVPQSARAGASVLSSLRPRLVNSAATENGGAMPAGEPLRLRTDMEIAVDLTTAIASRMKPPPKPPRDLKPSTALWILTTGLGAALLAISLLSSSDFMQAVFAVGAGQVIAGYAWVTIIAFRRDIQRGVVCAVPPLTFLFLANWKYARYRPLRLVLSGTVFIGLTLIAPLVQARLRSWAGAGEPQPAIAAQPEIASQSKLAQLRHYRDQRRYDDLLTLLRTLARTDSIYSDEAKNRIDLAADLRTLTRHIDSGVRIEALAAYAAWGGPDARELCLEASRSANSEERKMALRLLPRWKDEDVARRIAEMIGRAGTETSAAQDALITIGGPIAERAVIPLLRKDDQSIRLTAIDILGNDKVGGADAVAALKEVARTSPDPGTRQPAEAKAEQIKERLKK